MTAFEISQIQFHQYVVKGHFISVIFYRVLHYIVGQACLEAWY